MTAAEKCTKCGRLGLDTPGLCKACEADRANTWKKVGSAIVTIAGTAAAVIVAVIRRR